MTSQRVVNSTPKLDAAAIPNVSRNGAALDCPRLIGVFYGRIGVFEQLALLLGVLLGGFLLLPVSFLLGLLLGLLLGFRLFLLVLVEDFLLLPGGLIGLAITFGDAGVWSLRRG